MIKNVFASLYDLSRLVKTEGPGLEKDLEKVRVLATRALDFNLLSIFQFDYWEQKLLPVYIYGDSFSLVDAVNFRLGKGATKWCSTKKRPLIMKNLNRSANSEGFFVNSFLGVPIIINDNVVGVIVLGSFKSNQYETSDRFLVELMAPYLGTILLKENFQINQEEKVI